jgi:hypothetical protein
VIYAQESRPADFMDHGRSVEIDLTCLHAKRHHAAGTPQSEEQPVHETLGLIHTQVVKSLSVLDKHADNPLKPEIERKSQADDQHEVRAQLGG